jgi:hypothetical protein
MRFIMSVYTQIHATTTNRHKDKVTVQVWQLSDVARYAACLILGKHLWASFGFSRE